MKHGFASISTHLKLCDDVLRDIAMHTNGVLYSMIVLFVAILAPVSSTLFVISEADTDALSPFSYRKHLGQANVLL